MLKQFKTSLLYSSTWLLVILMAIGYAGNYFSYPFGFGVDFLFGSVAVLIVVSLYGIWLGTLASLIASSYTIILWQHPYALIIFVCEALFVAWKMRRGKQNLLTSDIIFWLCIGIPLVLLFYGYILQVGVVTTSIIALKQPVNGIFNSLIASLVLNCKPIYHWANSSPNKATVFFEQILLNLLVAFVLIPALILMVVNNNTAMLHEQETLIATLDASAQNLVTDLRRWHQSGLEALRFLAQTSSQSQIVVSGQTQHSINLVVDSLALFKDVYIVNADFQVIAEASISQQSVNQQLDFSQLELPRIPQIFVISEPNSNERNLKPKILQTLPIILNERWLGNIIAELNIDFIEQLLETKTYSVPLRSTLVDENQLLIASTNQELDQQQKSSRYKGEISDVKSVSSKQKIYHWLPIIEGKPLIARWRESFYVEQLFIDEEIPLILKIEAPAKSYIDYLQLLYIRSLAILLAIALSSILIAKSLSRILVDPIVKLAIFTTDFPYKILRNETIALPRNSVVEMNALANNFEVMSTTIEKNIQQIKLTNQGLKQAKEKSEIANKAKDKFLANISQELKTPLNSIIGYSRLLQKNLNSEQHLSKNQEEVKYLGWLENVQREGKYLLTLIDEILDLAESQAQQTKLDPTLIYVSSFMEDLVVYGRRKAAQKSISFKFETSGKLPTNIYADEPRLRQILLNLLNNAVKFTEQGQIILQIKEINPTDTQDESNNIVPLDEPSSQICLRFIVADTGIGISQQNLTKIFQPFEQINKYEAQEVGAGLGLSTSKQLVELMGGKLNVKSEPNQGSIFWFDLAFSPIKVTSAIEAQSFGEIIGYQGSQLTILIVDDVKTSRLLLSNILEPLGFKVLTAPNGEQGLQLALANQPDLILTDLFMPIKTGFTLIAELRQRDNFAKTPIIAVSASSFEEVERHSRASGCNSFISKPIDDQRLLNLLGNYLNLQWIYQYNKNNQS
jgi:signal transduction histidine kinase/ActR/RegA family two-component response regulator